MPSRTVKILRTLALLAALFAFCIVMFGAFVRLSNAGLSCPDWPTCYGKATWPGHAQDIAQANEAFPDRPYETHKAWREQVHRFLAGGLGFMVLAIALVSAWRRRVAVIAVLLAAAFAVVGVVMYIRGEHVVSSCLSALAIALPLIAAATLDRPGAWKIGVVALAVIIFQAMLGMWTVTLLLKPIVVMGHLLGGLATFALLAWAALRWWRVGTPDDRFAALRTPVAIGIVVLVCQIALGGWTSSNYAAIACPDFPKCQDRWLPETDYKDAFVLWRGLGVNYEGGVLQHPARVAIHFTHRLGAVVATGALIYAVVATLRRKVRSGTRLAAFTVLGALGLQLLIGSSMVLKGFPLALATAHNAGAALLLLSSLALYRALRH